MLETAFTRLVGCSVPIQLAGMGSILSPELAAAVSNAGALGQVTFAGIDVADARWRLDRLSSLHDAGALASWQVGSTAEAMAAEAAGCDFIIAQGIEAGGHIRGTIGLLPLLSSVLDAVSVPVLAAGGVGSGRSIAAVLSAGAAGVRMGTRFIAATEANAHPDYVKALIGARAEDSVRTSKFHVKCALCPSTHGVLRQAIEAADSFQGDFVAEIDNDGGLEQIERFRGTPPFKGFRGHIEAMACYAGQSVGDVTRVQPAAEIVAELVKETESLLRRSPVSA